MTRTIAILILAGIAGCDHPSTPTKPFSPSEYVAEHHCKRWGVHNPAGDRQTVISSDGHRSVNDLPGWWEYQCPDGAFIAVEDGTVQP